MKIDNESETLSSEVVSLGQYVTIPIYRKTEYSFYFTHYARLKIVNIQQVWFVKNGTYIQRTPKTITVFGYTFYVPFCYDNNEIKCSFYQIVYLGASDDINGKPVKKVYFLKSTIDPLVHAIETCGVAIRCNQESQCYD